MGDTTEKKHAFRLEDVPVTIGTDYPKPFDSVADGREKRKVGDHVGLSGYGINIVTLPPGSASAQRHWHEKEEEFTCILEGELVLVTEDGEETVTSGMMMGFPAGYENGHHLVNRSAGNAVYMEIGTRCLDEVCHYPDIDLKYVGRDGVETFFHKDGTPYPSE
ncbi:MAG: cupin domain-containing protein [Rhodospirillales bacterium]|nr:cupin domain-containing protein [Rhodospirillales bacterium]